MKRIFKNVMVGATVAAFALAGNVIAAPKEKEKTTKPQAEQQSSQSRQMQQKLVKTIFDYRDVLKLGDDQIEKIKELLSELNKEITILRARLTLVNTELQDLLKKDGDMNQIKSRIKEAFDIQASMKIMDMETARKINSVLTSEQLKKWREIQAAARK